MRFVIVACAVLSGAVVRCHAHDPHTHTAQCEASPQPSTAQPTAQSAQGPSQTEADPPSTPEVKQALANLDQIVARAGTVLSVQWSAEEQVQDIAIRELSRNESNSLHWVRARGAEKPHTHDTHDLVVVLLSGSVRAHLGDQVIEARAGETLTIPRKVPHWVENTGEEPSLSLAIFSPPFDGKDRHFIGQ